MLLVTNFLFIVVTMASEESSIHDVLPSVPLCYPSSLNNTSLRDKFRDLDDKDQFSACRKHLKNEDAKNFIVDFGTDEAWCAVDLDDSEFSALLGSVCLQPLSIHGVRCDSGLRLMVYF